MKLYSETSPEAKKWLEKDLGLKTWQHFKQEHKESIYNSLKHHFFMSRLPQDLYSILERFQQKYPQHIKISNIAQDRMKHKAPKKLPRIARMVPKDFVAEHIAFPNDQCCFEATLADIKNIFIDGNTYIVLEFLSFYFQETGHSEKDIKTVNDLLSKFGIKEVLTKDGFMPKQEDVVLENLTSPVLTKLGEEKYKEVNNHLRDALKNYRQSTPQSYSTAITQLVTSLEAFLQITVGSKKSTIAKLIREGIQNGKLPKDPFSQEIMQNIQSTVMQQRQKKGDPHPKEEYANEADVRFILNLVFVFMLRCFDYEEKQN